MLVECGLVRAVDSEGQDWSFSPSLARIASLGSPEQIVAIYAGLHGPNAAADAAYVLACCCDQDDPIPLIGGVLIDPAEPGIPASPIPARMPVDEQIIIARHLMQHGIVGRERPGARGSEGGKFATRFDAAEYVAAARVHLGMSAADAEALSMTEFQMLFEMKFPDEKKQVERDVPSRDEYDAAMARLKGVQRGR